MTITSGDAEKTYDGEKAAKEEVTEDPAFPEGEGFVYTWTSNVVNVEDTADANNTFTYDGQTGTSLNNYDVTRVYGKLTVTPRDITISSKDKTWPYDSQEHSCTAEDVELISGSWALAEEGLEYYNFASIIDYTEEGLANTFEYKANSFTEIENYNIHAQYKKIYISKVATPIIVNPKRAEKTYDGTPLTCKEYDYDKSILKGADKLQATVSGSITDFGTGTSYIEKASDVKIFRGETDATNNYTFGTHGEGILEIFKRSISLKSGSDTFTYNGQVHYCKTVSIESGS